MCVEVVMDKHITDMDEGADAGARRKIVLITGGTSGIGLACAIRFYHLGYNVAIMGRNEERGIEAIKKIGATSFQEGAPAIDAAFNCDFADEVPIKLWQLHGTRLCYIQGDVTSYKDCIASVEGVVKRFGTIDILINSAGIYMEKGLEDMSEDDFCHVMDTNLKGTYFMTQQAVAEMKKNKAGAVINISSDAGIQGNMLCSAYCASKGAVNMFTKAMALELAPWNIRINCVCPGDVMTPLTENQLAQYPDRGAAIQEMREVYPLKRIGTPEEIAAVVEFLSSEAAGFVTGAIWAVDGGITA